MTDNPKTFDQAAVRTRHEIPCPKRYNRHINVGKDNSNHITIKPEQMAVD